MKNFRYIFRFLSEFISRFKTLIILGIGIGILGFFLIKIFGPNLFFKKTETIGVVGKYQIENLPSPILSMVSKGLTQTDESGIALPDLAKSWESPDGGQTWIFHLKDNLTWQDGKKVIAKDIIYDFSDAKEETPDAKTIVFKLQSAFAPFPLVVSQPVFRKGLLGTGAWKVTKASLSGNYIQRLVLLNGSREEKIYKFYPTEERAKLALKLGSIHSLQDIFSKEPLDSWQNLSIVENVNNYRYATIFFNNQDSLVGTKEVRQALAYAINKSKLPGPRAYGPISPDSWVYNAQVKSYNFDSAKSESLISKLPKAAKDNLKINLATSVILLPVAEQIAKDWEKVGVQTNVQVVSGIPSDYSALLAILDIPKDPDQYALWHSTQTATNFTKYQDPRIDKLLEDGRVELDPEKRKKIYLDFQRFLVEDSPAIFLYHPITYTITRK